MIIICLECGKKKKLKDYGKGSGRLAKYCSQKCRSRYNNRRYTKIKQQELKDEIKIRYGSGEEKRKCIRCGLQVAKGCRFFCAKCFSNSESYDMEDYGYGMPIIERPP